ncbi:MAG: ABC transporter permease [Pseudomonadota bacterium]|nr:ABC transporter permease [Pseudomonadota bacterium]
MIVRSRPSSLHAIVAVFLKELRETLRDPNAFLLSVLYPLLLYPSLVWAANLWTEYQTGQLEGERAPIAVVGAPAEAPGAGAPRADVPADVVAALTAAEALEVVAVTDADAALADGTVAAVVRITTHDGGLQVHTTWRSDEPISSRAHTRVEEALAGVRTARVAANAVTAGLAPEHADVKVTVQEDDKSALVAWSLSMMVPFVLVLNGMIAGFYPAVEAAVGERERGTLETTLVCATSPAVVFAGKLACVFTIVIVATIVNLGAFLLSLWQLLQLLDVDPSFAIGLTPGVWLGVLGCAVLAALVLNAWEMLAVIRARDFKQAQNIASLFLIVGMGASAVGALQGFGPELGMGLIPVSNLVLVMREWIAGREIWPWASIAIAENLLLAIIPVLLAARVASGEGWRVGSHAPASTKKEAR